MVVFGESLEEYLAGEIFLLCLGVCSLSGVCFTLVFSQFLCLGERKVQEQQPIVFHLHGGNTTLRVCKQFLICHIKALGVYSAPGVSYILLHQPDPSIQLNDACF